MVEQKISLDFSKNGVQRTVHARQGENASRDILISLVSNGEPVDVSDYSMRVIYPDGTHTDLAKKNPVKVTIPQALCVEVGEKICEIQISYETEGATLYSPQFRVLVEGTILGASGSSEPIADPTVYQPLIAELDPYPSTLGTNAKIPIYDSDEGETLLADPDVLLGDVLDALDDKVDKVVGKGLSTNDYTTAEKNKLSGIESGAEANDITDVQDENGNSLVTSKIAVIPSGNPTELVADEYYDLNFTTTAILEKYEASIAMTYEAHPVILVEKYGANGADIFYISKYSGQIVVYRARYQNQTTLSGQIVVGAFSDNNYTSAEKTKLEGIDAGAEVNDVTDVQDTGGNSLVTNKVAVVPNAMIEIYDKTESSVDYAKFTGSDLYSLVASSDSGGKIYCINGNQIVGMSSLGDNSYFIYYLIGGAFSSPADFGCSLRRKTLNDSKVLSNDALCGTFSKNDYTSSEKTKLSGIATGAQVNVIEKIKDSNGTELTITNKAVTLPAIPAAQIQSDWAQTDIDALDYIKNKPSIPSAQVQSDYAQSNSSAVDYIKNKPNLATVATSGSYNDLSDKPTIPTAGTIASGSTGYATGGDVYTAIGNIPQIPVGTNTGDILVWDGHDWVSQQPSRLPYGYTEIEYLESSGTQYIETDIILKGTTRIVIDFEFKDSFSQWGGIIGAWNENKQFVLTWSDSDGKVDARHGTSYILDLNFSRNKRYLLSFGETLIECSDLNGSYYRLSFEQSNTIGLFSYGHNNPKAERIWHFYHYESDVLLHEFVPCIRDSDSEPGMYDVVNGVFYTNDGTGDFIVPSES